MRVLGVEIKGTDVQWIILNGTYNKGNIENLEKNKIPLPISGQQPIDNLIVLRDMIVSFIEPQKIDSIAIIKAQGGAQGSKPIRAKIECMVELAAKDLNIPYCLVAPQSVTNAINKKFMSTVSDTFENIFCGGNNVAPQYLEKAAYCAWIVLNGNRQ